MKKIIRMMIRILYLYTLMVRLKLRIMWIKIVFKAYRIKYKMKLNFKVFYIKHILGQCRKRCKNCDYKFECYNNLE